MSEEIELGTTRSAEEANITLAAPSQLMPKVKRTMSKSGGMAAFLARKETERKIQGAMSGNAQIDIIEWQADMPGADDLMKQAIELHDVELPLDKLPPQFLREVVSKRRGTVLLAVVKSNAPTAGVATVGELCPASTYTSHEGASAEMSTQQSSSGEQKDDDGTTGSNGNVASAPSTSSPSAPLVIGCIVGLFMYHWSRLKDAEFQFKHIWNVFAFYVSHAVRNRGVGSMLFDELARRAIAGGCEELALEVRSTNTNAIRFYEHKGLKFQDEEDEYYERGRTEADRRMREYVAQMPQDYVFSKTNRQSEQATD